MKPTLKGTLILTFSLREKELAATYRSRSTDGDSLSLPLPEGEGLGEGQAD
jgi:hypothetical protein